jgi:hypothetical protein
MGRPIALTASALMLGIAAGCGHAAAPKAAADPAVVVSVPPALPDVVDVVCAPDGTRVSATRFVAQPDGLHVRVQNTSGKSGVYLNYGGAQGLGGGEPVDSGTVLVLGPAPGPVHLNCAHDTSEKQDRPVTIEVLDPAHAWQTGALAKLGCSSPESSTVSWAIGPGEGSTADAALAAVATDLGKPLTWRHVQDGYVAEAAQVYVLAQAAGKAWATATVTRSASGNYVAMLGSLCSAAEPLPTS